MNSLEHSPNIPFHQERYVPYHLLWIKVIVRAAFDHALWRDSRDVHLRKCALEAGKWLFEPSSLTNGFDYICFVYGLPGEKLRKWARALTREGVKRFEFRDRNGKNDLFNAALRGNVEPEVPVKEKETSQPLPATRRTKQRSISPKPRTLPMKLLILAEENLQFLFGAMQSAPDPVVVTKLASEVRAHLSIVDRKSARLGNSR